MKASTLHTGQSLCVIDFQCSAGPGAPQRPEVHLDHSLSFVREGTFTYHARGKTFDLVPGAILIGAPAAEYSCSHEHRCGDQCLSFSYSLELASELRGRAAVWSAGALPPLPELATLGELAQSAARGGSDIGLDEIGVALAIRTGSVLSDRTPSPLRVSGRDRRRAVESALWIEANAAEPVDLELISGQAGLSPFHFLRLFAKVVGVTPHQYLIQCRLGRAAHLLAEEDLPVTDVAYEVGFGDLSNFVRTFRRATGLSPRQFRKAALGDSNYLQVRQAAVAY